MALSGSSTVKLKWGEIRGRQPWITLARFPLNALVTSLNFSRNITLMTKLVINRIANFVIKVMFRLKFNDVTNAFKGYRANVIQGCRPLISPHFNLTVELPLKAIVRGYTFRVIPISWSNREVGVSSLKLREQGSRYL